MSAKFEIYQGSITDLDVDAIVNAANSTLLGGGGVDGAIHRAAGSELKEACRTLNGCETGEVKVTPGFNLKARYVIHAVGPVWQGGGAGESESLANCYRRSFEIARAEELRSIAFPAISTGAYRFPPELAARIAIETCREQAEISISVERVVFACFDSETADVYQSLLG
jgi:O-acetyl-ADP-ribose deacetylase (regulator of RNase III)